MSNITLSSIDVFYRYICCTNTTLCEPFRVEGACHSRFSRRVVDRSYHCVIYNSGHKDIGAQARTGPIYLFPVPFFCKKPAAEPHRPARDMRG